MVVVGNALLRLALTFAHRMLKAYWFVRRPQSFGAHAIPVTPNGNIVLVKLRYARGWRLPGGGRSGCELAELAVLRDLREEIGMTSHRSVEPVGELRDCIDFKRDTSSIFIVRDVRFRPKWSLEVEDVTEVAIDQLPQNTTPHTARLIRTLETRISKD